MGLYRLSPLYTQVLPGEFLLPFLRTSTAFPVFSFFEKFKWIECDSWKASARDEGSAAADKAADAVKQGVEAAKKGGQEMKDKAASAAEDVSGQVPY